MLTTIFRTAMIEEYRYGSLDSNGFATTRVPTMQLRLSKYPRCMDDRFLLKVVLGRKRREVTVTVIFGDG